MDKYTISVRSIAVFDAIVADAAHHEIVIKNDGKDVYVINGLAFEKATGRPEGIASDGVALLKAAVSDRSLVHGGSINGEDPQIIAEHIVFDGDASDMMVKLANAGIAAEYINNNDVDYIAFSLGQAQNSNSVAYTLLKAMEIEIPPEVDNVWAPGFGRNLMPSDWKPPFQEVPSDEKGRQIVLERFGNLFDKNKAEDLARAIRDDKDSENLIGRSAYFDPDQHPVAQVFQPVQEPPSPVPQP